MANTKNKTQLDYLQGNSLRDILIKVNTNNSNCSTEHLILREDIVELRKEGESYILLYYK